MEEKPKFDKLFLSSAIAFGVLTILMLVVVTVTYFREECYQIEVNGFYDVGITLLKGNQKMFITSAILTCVFTIFGVTFLTLSLPPDKKETL